MLDVDVALSNIRKPSNLSSSAYLKNTFWIPVCQKRPYFHVTKLDVVELDSWHKYLGFEEGRGDLERAAFLYERCLVACALYDKFWLRYARWMFSQGKEENARIIYVKKGKTTKSCLFSWSSPKASGTIQMSFLLPPWWTFSGSLSARLSKRIMEHGMSVFLPLPPLWSIYSGHLSVRLSKKMKTTTEWSLSFCWSPKNTRRSRMSLSLPPRRTFSGSLAVGV